MAAPFLFAVRKRSASHCGTCPTALGRRGLFYSLVSSGSPRLCDSVLCFTEPRSRIVALWLTHMRCSYSVSAGLLPFAGVDAAWPGCQGKECRDGQVSAREQGRTKRITKHPPASRGLCAAAHACQALLSQIPIAHTAHCAASGRDLDGDGIGMPRSATAPRCARRHVRAAWCRASCCWTTGPICSRSIRQG